jgi:hypothetical protein
MGLFKKKDTENDATEFNSVDKNKQDKLQVVISRLENDTKVTIKQFWATHWVDTDSKVAYWVNEKQKFKQPVSDYYLTTIKSDIKKDKEKIQKELVKLKAIYEKEIDSDKPDPKINIKDVEHEIEVLEHQDFLLKFASNGYSVLSRNLQNFRKIEYLDIGNRLYPLGFNPKLMTYFIIPIDKDITLDKHRENVTLKHTTAFQKLIASATILMLILTIGLTIVAGFTGYKLYFAYDNTKIAELERACASNAMMNMQQYTQVTQEFKESTESFTDFVERFASENQDLNTRPIINPQNQGDLN